MQKLILLPIFSILLLACSPQQNEELKLDDNQITTDAKANEVDTLELDKENHLDINSPDMNKESSGSAFAGMSITDNKIQDIYNSVDEGINQKEISESLVYGSEEHVILSLFVYFAMVSLTVDKEELTRFMTLLANISQESLQEQVIIMHKLQPAQSRSDHDESIKMTIKVLESQKSNLNNIELTNPRLLTLRKNLTDSIDESVEVNKTMLLATKQPNHEIQYTLMKTLHKSESLAESAKSELMTLTNEVQ